VKKTKWITVFVLSLVAGNLLAQEGPHAVDTKKLGTLDAKQEKRAMQSLSKVIAAAICRLGQNKRMGVDARRVNAARQRQWRHLPAWHRARTAGHPPAATEPMH
jgi:hypothetical protein